MSRYDCLCAVLFGLVAHIFEQHGTSCGCYGKRITTVVFDSLGVPLNPYEADVVATIRA